MKKLFVLLIVCCLSLTFLSAQDKIKLNDELFISKISKSEYIVAHNYPWNSNSMIIKTSDKEVVLIDTPYEPSATRQILKWIDENLKPEKITAINTGFHIDNLGGNSVLLERGIEVYGADLTCDLLDKKSEATRKQILSWLEAPRFKKYREVYETVKFEKPNKIFKIEEGITLKSGSFTFEVYYPGESHSPDNVVVYIKETNTLFGGCMIKSAESKTLGFTGDANMKEWPNAVKKVKAKYGSAKLVIPHHGNWGGQKLIDHTLELFEK